MSIFHGMHFQYFSHPACPEGYYGKDCMKLCDCGKDGQCDPVSGKCLCRSGTVDLTCHTGTVILFIPSSKSEIISVKYDLYL